MTRHIFTIKTTARELRAIVNALISAEQEAEGDAWLTAREAAKYPEDIYTSFRNQCAQERFTQMREALDSLYAVVNSVSDEAGNWIHVMKDDAEEEIA